MSQTLLQRMVLSGALETIAFALDEARQPFRCHALHGFFCAVSRQVVQPHGPALAEMESLLNELFDPALNNLHLALDDLAFLNDVLPDCAEPSIKKSNGRGSYQT
jgi:hypothetical protein